jgi:NADH-quinone oxidoreductase subunit C
LSEDKEKLISEAVEKALKGDKEAINSIEDRVTRAKAKAALVKSKRNQTMVVEESTDTNSEVTPDKSQKLNLCQEIAQKIEKKFPKSIDGEQNEKWIQLKPENWFEIANYLKSDEGLFFDSLQCNTGVDIGEGFLDSRYNLHSMKHLNSIEIRIKVSIENPEIPSVEKIWRVADWFERETYDMFGIVFSSHSDLRRILLPEDWEGWPLRKDYEVQETYHGIVIPKVKEGWE